MSYIPGKKINPALLPQANTQLSNSSKPTLTSLTSLTPSTTTSLTSKPSTLTSLTSLTSSSDQSQSGLKNITLNIPERKESSWGQHQQQHQSNPTPIRSSNNPGSPNPLLNQPQNTHISQGAPTDPSLWSPNYGNDSTTIMEERDFVNSPHYSNQNLPPSNIIQPTPTLTNQQYLTSAPLPKENIWADKGSHLSTFAKPFTPLALAAKPFVTQDLIAQTTPQLSSTTTTATTTTTTPPTTPTSSEIEPTSPSLPLDIPDEVQIISQHDIQDEPQVELSQNDILATNKENSWSAFNQDPNAPIYFSSVTSYQSHFTRLVQMEHDADQLATSKSIEDLGLTWELTQHHITNTQNLTANFTMSQRERSKYRIMRAARVLISNPAINKSINGFINNISRQGTVIIMIDPKSFDLIGNEWKQFPTTSNYILSFIFDDSIYKRMNAALESMKFDPILLRSFLGLPPLTNSSSSSTSTNDRRVVDGDGGYGNDIINPSISNNLTLNSTFISQNQQQQQQQHKNEPNNNSPAIKQKYLPEIIEAAPGLGAHLNASQRIAIQTALTSPYRITTITGPPGTGKTLTAATTVYQLHQALRRQYEAKLKKIDNQRGNIEPYDYENFIKKRSIPEILPIKPSPILVAAPSNVAVDHIASLLVKIPGLDILRISSKRYRTLKFAAADDAVENCALHKRIESWLLMNPGSELGILHNRIFSGLDDSHQQTLIAKIDGVMNDDSVLSSHVDYSNNLKVMMAMRDTGDYYNSDDDDDDDDDDDSGDDDDEYSNDNDDYSGRGKSKKAVAAVQEEPKKKIVLNPFGQNKYNNIAKNTPKQDPNAPALHQDKQFTERLLAQLDIPPKSAQGLSQGELSLWRKLYLELQYRLINQADVVCVTFAFAGNPLLLGNSIFSHVILDEVSQSTEPQLLLPLMYQPRQLILFGDQQQLGPVVQSTDAAKLGYDRSLFCRLLITKSCSNCLLDTQYRMHPSIARFSSSTFYNNLLLDGDNTHSHHAFKYKFPWPNSNLPICWLSSHNLPQSGEERIGTSIINRSECLLIQQLLIKLVRMDIPIHSIGIVIPYKAQIVHLMSILCDSGEGQESGGGGGFAKLIENKYFSHRKNQNHHNNNNNNNNTSSSDSSNNSTNSDPNQPSTIELAVKFIEERLTVDSADGFQGREKPIIIFGCVRSAGQSNDRPSGLGFLYDLRRLNVALTRARDGIIIVGDHLTLKQGTWGKLLEYYWTNNAIVTDTSGWMTSFEKFVNSYATQMTSTSLSSTGGSGYTSAGRKQKQQQSQQQQQKKWQQANKK